MRKKGTDVIEWALSNNCLILLSFQDIFDFEARTLRIRKENWPAKFMKV